MNKRHSLSMEDVSLCDYEFPIASVAHADGSSKGLVGVMRVRDGTASLHFYVRHNNERVYTTTSVSDAVATYNDIDI